MKPLNTELDLSVHFMVDKSVMKKIDFALRRKITIGLTDNNPRDTTDRVRTAIYANLADYVEEVI